MRIAWLVVGALCAAAVYADEDRCRDRSCYPVTGNLLIGRKERLRASSTCGANGRQRFCIVSHLEDSTKCFYCDSRQPWSAHRDPQRKSQMSHRIENVVTEAFEDKTRNWWQSENGVQNVSITLDLEAEFHFTHLIMTFKSFRPAAMLIERSADFGKTWHVYRYFAYDCANTFPGIPEGNPSKHTDVVCSSQYSDVAPSTGGELVYKVISPHIATDDPYSDEISTLLKVTNLRFNFTKLHTLGEDLLDYRPEIDEKYYYAIYEIVVRGSCSCYGHASRCIPIDGSEPDERLDIVHGRCECMHNTEGLNCEKCRDFYNDMPWRPAIGTETNECKRCECNGHAARCHFDRAVFENSGHVSGGVCDDCMHNTQGIHCEQCKPYYYRDPLRPIYDPHVCLPCQCDPAGSLNDGICEGEEDPERGLVAGKCYCKPNVDGSRCDRCKNGYWNLTLENPDGCVPCTCNLLGTYNNEGCNKYDGACTCKRLVTGENCDQCLPEHYGLSDDIDGCKACDCDIGGSFNNHCDVTSGQCKCREGFSGRRCETADSSRFCANIDYYTYEAENANLTYADIEVRERPDHVREQTWTGEGFARVLDRSSIKFRVNNLQQSMDYNLVIRYDGQRDPVGWENVQVTIVRPDNPDPLGPCANADAADDFLIARLHPGGRYAEIRPAVCLEKGIEYEIVVQFAEKRTGVPNDRTAFMLIDSLVLAPPTESLDIFTSTSPRAQQHKTEYDRYQCRNVALSLTPQMDYSEVCHRYVCPVAAALLNKSIECDCDPTGSISGICDTKGGQCECKPNVVGRRCDQCAVGTYGFGPNGCLECACDSVGSLHNQCDKQSGQCLCREKGIYGRQCNQCQPGFWSFPDCRVCQCNDHANICDQETGACIECRDLSAGHYCDRCQDGYYGDPRLGVGLPCKPCPCPGGPTSGFQHADTCYLTRSNGTQDVSCNCRAGYTGDRCAECAVNHWGNPTEVGGTCERCDCNGNIDMNMPESCDATTGECLKCLHNTEGAQCENCMEGFFGDAKIRSCQRCVCNQLGTNATTGSCDRVTGQCPCFPNVIGEQCDQCAENHYNLASGEGCADCACDPNGVVESADEVTKMQCNRFDGQCECKRGRGGRTCSECENYFWGDPTSPVGCKQCECNPTGSANMQCHRNNGTCICNPGSGGPLCNECARGYTGQWPYCKPCGECFHQWDNIVQELKIQVETLISTASNIEDTGVASAYDSEFEKMEKELDDTKKKLEEANISQEHIDAMDKQVNKLRELMSSARERLDVVEARVANSTQAVDFAEEDLKSLEEDAQKVTEATEKLQNKANKIKEADVQGAYNITKESAAKSMAAQRRTDAAIGKLAEAESEARETEELMEKNREDFEKQYAENEAALEESERALHWLESALPSLNSQVCGAAAAPCDALCGGPGSCGFCGGQSCLEGAVSKADQAKSFSLEADLKLNEKQKEAEEVLTLVRDVLSTTEMAKRDAEKALEVAKEAAHQANMTRNRLDSMVNEMDDFISKNRSSPAQVRELAEEVLKMEISLKPDQIDELAKKIHNALGKISNIDAILAETKGNKTLAVGLEMQAQSASERAAAVKNTTDTVREALVIAETAQNLANDAIREAEEKMKLAREDLATARVETEDAESKAKQANQTLATIEGDMKKVKVQYLQISDDAKNAYNLVDRAQQAAATAEQQNKQMKTDMETARQLLGERTKGNEVPQKRAEGLRIRASKLLYKAQKYNNDINVLSRDSGDVVLEDYTRTLDELLARLERVTKDIDSRTEFYNNCG